MPPEPSLWDIPRFIVYLALQLLTALFLAFAVLTLGTVAGAAQVWRRVR